MPQLWNSRPIHYLLLVVLGGLLFLPNLGEASLWDIDEGHNAEAAREMLESGNWVVPTFNFQLRTDKPALLYWLQLSAFQLFGLNEFSSRLPSALAAILATLAVYELGRSMFSVSIGLLAACILATSVLFSAAAHFANPDSLLNAFTVLTFLCLWHAVGRGAPWALLPAGAFCGLAVLSKGPVGLALPTGVLIVFLVWSRRFGFLWRKQLAGGVLLFCLVSLPWYIWVGVDTKIDFLRGFILTHNVGRFLQPMESHSGPFFYYLLVLAIGFAPWSLFLGLVAWYGWRETRVSPEAAPSRALAFRFLWCWVGTYLIFFSLSRTKLPNYILPAYPAVALLTAWFLSAWSEGTVKPPVWAMPSTFVGLAFVGLVTTIGLLWASGWIELPGAKGHRFPGLERWAVLGIIPVIGGVLAATAHRLRGVGGALTAFSAAAALFTGSLAAFGSGALEAHKAPRRLLATLPADRIDGEIRIACYKYYQPSLVFYARREVIRFQEANEVTEFLTYPIPVYVIMSQAAWEAGSKLWPNAHVLNRATDMYRKMEVVIVSNRP